MYRQQPQNVPGGRGYPTEVAGRDRVKFFRRPVEPDNTVLDRQADFTNAQFAATCPSFTMPSNAAAFATTAMPSHVRAGNGGHLRGPRRPSSTLGTRPRQPQLAKLRGLVSHSQGPSMRRPYHLPSLNPNNEEVEDAAGSLGSRGGVQRDGRNAAGVQTVQRENEAQTDPYSPDYFIPEGAPTPEVLSLESLTYQNGGLPAGREEVQLIQRLRRRRDVEAALPTGTDAASVEARYTVLHELEEKEWAEREEHVAKLQQRRLDRMKESLLAREAAREDSNRARLERVKAQYLEGLGGKLTSLEKRRAASSKRGNEKMAELQAQQQFGSGGTGGVTTHVSGPGGVGARATSLGGQRTRGGPTIASYSRYGISGGPPPMASVAATMGASAGGASSSAVGLDAQHRSHRQVFNYDVRPQLLSDMDGTQLVDAQRGARMNHVPPQTFVVPENEAVQRLPTLYQRREAEHVLQSLEYAYKKIHKADDDAEESPESNMQRVLNLYRATPKLQRPDTPVLELDGDDEEEEEDACILLQRLLRGRAVQNDFFEGRERCRGLIEELQAASSAQTAEQQAAEKTQHEAEAAERAADVEAIVDIALGEVVHDTLGFLTQELLRQQDIAELRGLRDVAESVRQTREAAELARRAEVRQQRDRNEVAYTAYMRATDTTVQCFLDDVLGTAVEDTALDVAVAEELARQAGCPSEREPANQAEAEDIVCDMLDTFLLPTVVDAIVLQHRTLEKRAGGEAAIDGAYAAMQDDSASEGT